MFQQLQLPPQVLPKAQRDQTWCEDTMKAVITATDAGSASKQLERLCYDIYYGKQDDTDFEYLTGVGQFRMPAKVRNMDFCKPFWDILQSTYEGRPFEPQVFGVDVDTIDEKNDLRARQLTERIIGRISQRQQRISMAQLRLQGIRSQAAQSQDPQAQMNSQLLDLQLRSIEHGLSNAQDVVEEEMANYDRDSRFTLQTSNEHALTRGLEYLFAKRGLRDVFCEGFRDLVIHDNAVYAIDEVYVGRDPRIRRVNMLNFFYGHDEQATYIDECPWVVEREYLSIPQILDEFGSEMTPDQRDSLNGSFWQNQYMNFFGQNTFNQQPSGGSDCYTGWTSGSWGRGILPASGTLEVHRISWLSPRKVTFKLSDNKYDPDQPHIHVITDQEAQKKLRAGEHTEVRYQTDRYSGVCIGRRMYLRCGKAAMQYRDHEELGKAYHPYIGFAYNGTNRRAYSRVFAIKDVKILYNLVHYQQELLLAISNLRGFIMDRTQKPAGMSDEEWIYYAKLGVAWVDPTAEGPNGRPTGFNQFTSYSNAFGNEIAQYEQLKNGLLYLAGRIIGIPPERMGELAPNSQVGTQKQAIAQSNLATETLFYKQDQLKKRALDRLLMALPCAWADGKRGQYVLGSYGQRVVEIAKDQLEDGRYEVFYQGETERTKQRMDQMMMLLSQEYSQKGSVSLSQMAAALRVNNLHEMESLLASYEKVAMQRASSAQQAEQDHEKELIDLNAKADMMIKSQQSANEQAKTQLESMALQLQDRDTQLGAQTQLQIAQQNNETKRYVADQNTAVEGAYLDETKREHNIDTRLKQVELVLDQAQGTGQPLSSTPTRNRARD